MSETDHECIADPGRVSFPGPFSYNDVVVQGWSVPFVKASLKGEDRLRLILDERMALDLSAGEAERFIPFLADAIAVALGYGAHPGEDTKVLPERAPHAAPRRVVRVEMLPDAS